MSDESYELLLQINKKSTSWSTSTENIYIEKLAKIAKKYGRILLELDLELESIKLHENLSGSLAEKGHKLFFLPDL